jgi:hypothetical protein
VVSFISIGGSWKPASAVSGSNSMSYEEEDTCMAYEEKDTCMSYEEEDTCMSYEEQDTFLR